MWKHCTRDLDWTKDVGLEGGNEFIVAGYVSKVDNTKYLLGRLPEIFPRSSSYKTSIVNQYIDAPIDSNGFGNDLVNLGL